MGRSSKFSFPLPGRRKNKEKKEEKQKEVEKPSGPSRNFSKAHRILGTNDLNVGTAAARDDLSGYLSSKSSRMSVSISESTHSVNENASMTGSQTDQSEESGVFGRSERLRGKPSSTLLGQLHGDNVTKNTTSSADRRLRHEDSSSTLRSHYDRQKYPLSISQQTSESSARDLALRKGHPPVSYRNPLPQGNPVIDQNDNFSGGLGPASIPSSGNRDGSTREKGPRKKPAKLDLSMLFPRPQSSGGKTPDAGSINTMPSPKTPRDSYGRRKLTKPRSKESLQSQKPSVRPAKSHDPRHHRPTENLDTLYQHYEQTGVRSPRMNRIPESGIPDSSDVPTPRAFENHLSPGGGEPQFSWKNVRASMAAQRGDASSAASISSRNTKASRHTSRSAISTNDLKMKSILSLSSDSEGDDSEPERQPIRKANSSSHGNRKGPARSQQSALLSPILPESRKTINGGPQGGSFLSAPVSPSEPVTPPWSSVKDGSSRSSSGHRNKYRSPALKEKKPSRKMSVTSAGSSQQPTPPQSPASAEFRGLSDPNGLLMAVTKQEEALLEALRQKRTRMREEIIEEHEITKSPPRSEKRHNSRKHDPSSVARGHGITTDQERVLLYLDTPLSDSQQIDLSEPSPDLSDFLTFGSDEDSTPRTSWAPSKDHQYRSDSSVPSRFRDVRASPSTPPSAARLSAVGVGGGFKLDRPLDQTHGAGKRRNMGVRFVEDQKIANNQDFLLDENENEGEIAWAL